MVIVGGPQSGKSTLLRSLIASLALTHTPREVQFFCLDFGGGTLRSAGRPAARVRGGRPARRRGGAPDGRRGHRAAGRAGGAVRRAGHRLDRRATGAAGPTGEFADDPFGDVFLVVDGWGTLRQEYEELEQTITTLAGRGLGFGIHVVLTATRWAEIRINLRDLLGTKLELRLGDPSESEIDRRAAANVPEKHARPRPDPGQAALPRRAPAHRRSTGDRRPGRRHGRPGRSRCAAGWPYQPAPKVRLLPRTLAGGRAAAARRPAGAGHPDRAQRDAAGAGPPGLRRRAAPDASSATPSAARPTCCG